MRVFGLGLNIRCQSDQILLFSIDSFVCGIEFRETSLTISAKTTACARKSQVYNLNVGLSGLVNSSAESKELKNYSLFIGDTVVVNEVRSFLSP